MEEEKHVASKNMRKFFEKLLELKTFVGNKAKSTKDDTLIEIYNKLDKIIKIGNAE